ncbi:hypothetical protein EDC04DRAFT_2610200 [Pisolithus marmoratus]|nr:hypothetical protein EDC04DRAFT_2610200 [Pisolithus marmoratus]
MTLCMNAMCLTTLNVLVTYQCHPITSVTMGWYGRIVWKKRRSSVGLCMPFPIPGPNSLTMVVMQWTQCGVCFEPGCWPEKRSAMVQMLYEDMSTWHSKLKKAAISSAPLLYQLEPVPGVECLDHVMFAQDATIALLHQSMFLRNGVDENIMVCTMFNCVLDGFVKSGTGKWFLKFSAKSYVSVYNVLLALIEETLKNPDHGPQLSEQLGHWVHEGWAALQQVNTSVERHDHLQIMLD